MPVTAKATSSTTDSALNPDINEITRLDSVRPTSFVSGVHQPNRRRGIFGGQILCQALAAAARTVREGRLPSELKILFLLPGTPSMPVTFNVETLLEGGSFSIRRVRCEQDARLIADVTASFHREESGFTHQETMPRNIAPPEGLDNVVTLMEKFRDRLPVEAVQSLTRTIPVELRPVDPDIFMLRPAENAELWYWMKPTTAVSDYPLSHYNALAFMSDWWFSGSSHMQHSQHVVSNSFFVTSLNHTVWFHRPPCADDWLLFRSYSPSAYGGRGFCLGEVWDRQGTRIASLAQEALGRQFKAQP